MGIPYVGPEFISTFPSLSYYDGNCGYYNGYYDHY